MTPESRPLRSPQSSEQPPCAPVSPEALQDGNYSANVDVYYHQEDYPGAWGVNSCQNWSGHVCNRTHVIYDDDVGYDPLYDSASEYKQLACHETGHGLGLMHTNFSFWDNPKDMSG